jgi:hypothetical protein
MVYVGEVDAALLKTACNRVVREALVVLPTRESFFLRGRYNAAVDYKRGSTVVIVGRYA